MAAKGGLGKGLDALIPTSKNGADKKNIQSVLDAKEGEQVHIVKITQVEPNKDQPRKNFSEDELQELSDSIKQVGLINPIIVQDRKSDKDHYMMGFISPTCLMESDNSWSSSSLKFFLG